VLTDSITTNFLIVGGLYSVTALPIILWRSNSDKQIYIIPWRSLALRSDILAPSLEQQEYPESGLLKSEASGAFCPRNLQLC